MEDVRQNDAFISHTRRCPAGVALASEIYNELTHVHGKKVWLDVKAPNDDPSVHAMKEGVENFDAPYLFDEGSTISWIPCGRKLTCSYPGIKFFYGPDTFFGEEVSVLEMDGQFDKLEELIYVESHLSNTSTKFYGEITQQMLKYQNGPGSNNGTGLFQTLCGLKVRELYERISEKEVVTAA